MKYPKMQTLWMRDTKNKYVIMPGEFSRREFGNIKRWSCTEKIDGTNCRVLFEIDSTDEKRLTFAGKSEMDALRVPLREHLERTFTEDLLTKVLGPEKWGEEQTCTKVILFGEGYGGNIQKFGSDYSKEISFILFDAWIDGWWLNRESVIKLGEELEIETVPFIGDLTLGEIVSMIMSKPMSEVGFGHVLEGIVAQPDRLVLFRNGVPLKFKLKVVDYEKLAKFCPTPKDEIKGVANED